MGVELITYFLFFFLISAKSKKVYKRGLVLVVVSGWQCSRLVVGQAFLLPDAARLSNLSPYQWADAFVAIFAEDQGWALLVARSEFTRVQAMRAALSVSENQTRAVR